MKPYPFVLTIGMLLAAATLWAQGPANPDAGPPGKARWCGERHGGQRGMHRFRPFFQEGVLFSPESLMANSARIGLSEQQQGAIQEEIKKSMNRFLDLKWKMQKEEQVMETLLKPDKVDEKQVMAQLDKILGIEDEIKKTHATLLVRLKNILTPEQQAKLRDLQKNAPPESPEPLPPDT
jgi:Spy/CpxP family protein refolding chaperone